MTDFVLSNGKVVSSVLNTVETQNLLLKNGVIHGMGYLPDEDAHLQSYDITKQLVIANIMTLIVGDGAQVRDMDVSRIGVTGLGWTGSVPKGLSLPCYSSSVPIVSPQDLDTAHGLCLVFPIVTAKDCAALQKALDAGAPVMGATSPHYLDVAYNPDPSGPSALIHALKEGIIKTFCLAASDMTDHLMTMIPRAITILHHQEGWDFPDVFRPFCGPLHLLLGISPKGLGVLGRPALTVLNPSDPSEGDGHDSKLKGRVNFLMVQDPKPSLVFNQLTILS